MCDDAQFGDVLRNHRIAAGLTQEALAELAGISLRGLSDLERGLRRVPHPDTLLRLSVALRLDDADRAALRRAAWHRSTSPRSGQHGPAIARVELPVPVSSFVGREREVAEAQQLLAKSRLLTLTGPGGSGKTRLALQVASQAVADFSDGVVFVPLAAISDPDLVSPTIAQALGIRDLGGRSMLQRLTEYLRAKSMLLVLDNFEQVLIAGPQVSGLLSAARWVRVLVTSREPLRVQGEHEFAVRPLAMPAARDSVTFERVSQYGAVALFVDRAAAINPAFQLSEQNAAAVVEICRRLDGLPLAIELAAGWIRVLSPHDLRSRLEHRLALLTDGTRDLPPRQQTLRAAIDWSYALLSQAEQELFRRLSIFVGGCAIDAAEIVTGGGDQNLEFVFGLRSLVAKNLVYQQEAADGQTRVGMLETIREYGLELLDARGESALIRQQHATVYLALAEEAEPKLLSTEQVRWARRLQLEYDNLRAVMAWSQDGSVDGQFGLRLAGALAWFWVLSGVAWEARGWVDAMLGLPCARAATRERARALHARARVAIVQGDATAGRAFAAESADIFDALGDAAGGGRALSARGSAECIDGEYSAARLSLERSMLLAQRVGDRPGLAFALGQLGNVMEHEGDYDAAHRLREEAAALAREVGDRHSLGIALAGLAHLARVRGEFKAAAALFHDCLRLGTELGPSWRVLPRALGGLAGLACMAGDNRRSAHLFGAAESLWDASGKRDMPWWQAVFHADTLMVRRALGDGPFGELVAEGRAMSLEDVIAYALET